MRSKGKVGAIFFKKAAKGHKTPLSRKVIKRRLAYYGRIELIILT